MNSLTFLFIVIAIFTLTVGYFGCSIYSDIGVSDDKQKEKTISVICFILFVLGIGTEIYINLNHTVGQTLLIVIYIIQSIIQVLHFLHYFKGLGICSGPQHRTSMFNGIVFCFILFVISIIPLIQSIFFY